MPMLKKNEKDSYRGLQVEEWELDETNDQEVECCFITMDKEGNVKEIEKELHYNCSEIFPYFDDYGNVCLHVLADGNNERLTEERAIKVANEIRTQFIATNQWIGENND